MLFRKRPRPAQGQAHTALGKLKAGDTVNLETDLIGKHVRRTLETGQAPTPLTWDRLRTAGFGEG